MPSVKQLNPTIVAGFPWIAQSTALFSPPELQGLLSSLTPAIQGTSSTLTASKALLNGSDELARCFIHDVIPTGNQKISDPPITTGLRVYQELFQSAVGLAGVAQNFDGNGRYVRAAAGGGSDRVQTGPLGRPDRCSATRSCRRSGRGPPSRARRRLSVTTFPATRTRSRT